MSTAAVDTSPRGELSLSNNTWKDNEGGCHPWNWSCCGNGSAWCDLRGSTAGPIMLSGAGCFQRTASRQNRCEIYYCKA